MIISKAKYEEMQNQIEESDKYIKKLINEISVYQALYNEVKRAINFVEAKQTKQ